MKAIQEAVASKGYYGDDAMVATNSFFTRQAKELARRNDVILWDRDDLVKTLISIGRVEVSRVQTDQGSTTAPVAVHPGEMGKRRPSRSSGPDPALSR